MPAWSSSVRLPGLTYLGLSGTGVSDAGMKTLAQIPSLQMLDLGRTAVTDAGVAELRSLPKLTWLFRAWLIDCAGLAGLDQLVHLWVNNTRVSNAQLAVIGNLTQLKTLDLDATASPTRDCRTSRRWRA